MKKSLSVTKTPAPVQTEQQLLKAYQDGQILKFQDNQGRIEDVLLTSDPVELLRQNLSVQFSPLGNPKVEMYTSRPMESLFISP